MASIDMEVDIPSAEELKNSKTEFDKSPLQDGVYICRVNKVELRKVPEYVNGRPDYSKLKLEWQAILSPIKQLSGDPLLNVKGGAVPALSGLIWKKANPFAMGMKQDGTPSNLRALFAYGLGLQVDGALKVSKIVVLDKNEEVASEADTQAYALEYSKLRKAEIQPDQATMKVAGFKHVPDLAAIEGKYIAASLAVDGDYNKVVGLSKVPMSFDASAVNASYAEEITKFNDVVYPRIIEARKKKASARTQGADNIAPDFAVTESSISLDDIPF